MTVAMLEQEMDVVELAEQAEWDAIQAEEMENRRALQQAEIDAMRGGKSGG